MRRLTCGRMAVVVGVLGLTAFTGPAAFAQTLDDVTDEVSTVVDETQQEASEIVSDTSDTISGTSGAITETTSETVSGTSDTTTKTTSETTSGTSGTVSTTTSKTSTIVSGSGGTTSSGTASSSGAKGSHSGGESGTGRSGRAKRLLIVDTCAEASRDPRLLALWMSTFKERQQRQIGPRSGGGVLGALAPGLEKPPAARGEPFLRLPLAPEPLMPLYVLILLGLAALAMITGAKMYAAHNVTGSWNPVRGLRRRWH
jgi:hypothetical protein